METSSEGSISASHVRLLLPMAAQVLRVVILAMVVLNVLNAYVIVADPRVGDRAWLLLDGESNPTTWLSASIWLCAAMLAWLCSQVDGRARRLYWSAVALVLLGMSFDEVATVHERVGGNLGAILGDKDRLEYLWVVPVGMAAIGVLGVLWRMRPHLPPATRRALLLGAGTAIGGAVLLEAARPLVFGSYGMWTTQVLVLTSLEENLEMIGGVIVNWALFRHAARLHEGRPRVAPLTRSMAVVGSEVACSE